VAAREVERDHQKLLNRALAAEAEAHRLLMDGRSAEATPVLRGAASLYRLSWEAAPPRAYGRLIGMLKAAVLYGGEQEAAEYVRDQIGEAADSAPASYGLALAALAAGDDEDARRAAEKMRSGSEAFARTAEAIEALAGGDRARYEEALRAIIADFEARDQHLTGVAIADTALVLERLAEPRGLAVRPRSPLLPPAGSTA
jgi:hypothetical protein